MAAYIAAKLAAFLRYQRNTNQLPPRTPQNGEYLRGYQDGALAAFNFPEPMFHVHIATFVPTNPIGPGNWLPPQQFPATLNYTQNWNGGTQTQTSITHADYTLVYQRLTTYEDSIRLARAIYGPAWTGPPPAAAMSQYDKKHAVYARWKTLHGATATTSGDSLFELYQVQRRQGQGRPGALRVAEDVTRALINNGALYHLAQINYTPQGILG